MMPYLTAAELQAVKIASGYQSGYRTPGEFRDQYGFDPRQFARLFQITPHTDLVCVLPFFRQVQDALHEMYRRNWSALGVGYE